MISPNPPDTTIATFNIIAQDCKLWAVANGSVIINTRKRDTSVIWQFAADENINATVIYEGPGSPNANAALELKIIPVDNPLPSKPPNNDARCLTPDDYWESNHSHWEFGFTKKHSLDFQWLFLNEDPIDYAWYWSAYPKRQVPNSWKVRINE